MEAENATSIAIAAVKAGLTKAIATKIGVRIVIRIAVVGTKTRMVIEREVPGLTKIEEAAADVTILLLLARDPRGAAARMDVRTDAGTTTNRRGKLWL